MTGRSWLAVGVLVFAVSGCGGDEPSSQAAIGDATAPAPTASFQPPERTPQQLAEAFGCRDFVDTRAAQLFTYASGRCTLDGAEVQIATFRDNAARDQWLAVGQQFGGAFAVGDRFAISARGIDLAPVAASVGAELR